MGDITIVDVTPENFFTMEVCADNDKFAEGKRKKEQWYRNRYSEGLRIKVAYLDDVKAGMIEYVPGEVTWRTLNAKGYTVIQCLQILRKYTRNGCGQALLQECIKDSGNSNGLAIITSSKPWVNDKKFFQRNGFRIIEKAPPYYELAVLQLKESVLPSFHNGWEERALEYGHGLTVVYTDQCPIIDYALTNIEAAASDLGININYHKIDNYAEAQNAPFPYGTFGIIKDGRFLTHRIFDKDKYASLFTNGEIL